MRRTRFITEAAAIGALYAALTILFAPISYGQIQVRVSEALTILPVFTPAAIPGLFVGCVLANLVWGAGIIDVVFGSLATLLAAAVTYFMPRRWLAPLPPVIFNGVVIGFVLYYVYQLPLFVSMLWVAAGEAVACYGLGYILMLQLEKYGDRIFKRSLRQR